MKKFFFMILLGLTIIFLQTWFFPSLLPFRLKPDLFLILVVYIGIYSEFYRGAAFSLLFGWFQDVFAGNSMGLYGLVFLIIYFLVRYGASRFNAEALGTFYYLVFFGTLTGAFLVCFFQSFFTDAGMLWYVVIQNLFPQLFLNMLFAFLLLRILLLLQWTTELAFPVPGRSSKDDF
jgi:rod shape-determining protein MreD